MFAMIRLVSLHMGNTSMKFINWMNSKYDEVISSVRAPFGSRLSRFTHIEPVSLVEIDDETPQCIMVDLPVFPCEES